MTKQWIRKSIAEGSSRAEVLMRQLSDGIFRNAKCPPDAFCPLRKGDKCFWHLRPSSSFYADICQLNNIVK